MKKLSPLILPLILYSFSGISYADKASSPQHVSNTGITISSKSNITIDDSSFITEMNKEYNTALSIDDDNDYSYEETDYGYD